MPRVNSMLSTEGITHLPEAFAHFPSLYAYFDEVVLFLDELVGLLVTWHMIHGLFDSFFLGSSTSHIASCFIALHVLFGGISCTHVEDIHLEKATCPLEKLACTYVYALWWSTLESLLVTLLIDGVVHLWRLHCTLYLAC
jgi:hypothetical protein